MADPVNAGTPPDNAATPPNATDAKNGNGGDKVQLTKEQLDAAFEHPRFKQLTAEAAELKKLKAEATAREEAEAKQKGEFEKLYTTEKSRNETLVMENALQLAAYKAGAVDPEAVVKLVDRSKLKIEGDTVNGVNEAITALMESKPYLKGNGSANGVGNGTNPADGSGTNGGVKKFKLSQLQNAEFYRKNENDIQEALKNNQIENDLA